MAILNLDTGEDEGVISKNEWKSFDRLSPVAHLLDIFSARIGTKSSWDKLVKFVEEAGEQVVQLFISVTIANIVDILRVDPPSAGLTSWRTRRAGSSSAGRCSSPVSGCSPSAPAFCQKHNFPPAFYIKCSRLWISNFNQVHWNDLPLRHHTKNFNSIFWRLSQMKWKSVYHLGSPGGGQAGCAIFPPPMSPQPPPMSSQQAT